MKRTLILFFISFFSMAAIFAQEDNRPRRSLDSESLGRILRQRQNNQQSQQQSVVADDSQTETAVQQFDLQEPVSGNNFVNIGYSYMNMELPGMESLKPYYGLNLSVGRTFFYGTERYAELVRFGLDVVWFDVNYNNYCLELVSPAGSEDVYYHQTDVAVRIGPSATFDFTNDMALNGYVHYAPSASLLYADDSAYWSYGSFCVAGLSLSYKRVGLGLEYRYGSSKYKDFTGAVAGDDVADDKTVHSGFRASLTFKF